MNEEDIILPERYKRLEYLQSTGTQFIDTGIIPSKDTGAYIKALQTVNGNAFPIGAYSSSSPNSAWVPMRLLMKGNGSYPTYRWGTSWSDYSTTYNADVIYESKFNWLNDKSVNLFRGGELIISNTLSNTIDINPGCSASLFAVNYSNGSKSYYWKGRVYEIKISQGTDIVKHFIPAYDTYSARHCMYEIIEGKAYYNKGTGDFLYELDLEDTQLGILHKLPEGFTKVNYLIANGSQYIDTGYVPTNETGYYLEGQGYTTSETYYFGCNETSNWGDNKRIYFCATPNINWGWMTYGTLTNAAANLRQETKVSHNFLNSRISKATINEKDFTYNLPELNFTPTRNMYLFGVNLADSSASSCLKGRIDTFLISEGDQIVRQFVPCLDADGTPCMYELYTGTVHYNRGTGQFSYPREYTNGPINLPAGYTKCVYLQSDGTQWIDTGVIPNADTGLYAEIQRLNYGNYPFMGCEENGSSYYPPRFDTTTKAGVCQFGNKNVQYTFYYDKGDDLRYISAMNLYNDNTIVQLSDDTKWKGFILNSFNNTYTYTIWLFSYNMNGSSIGTYGKFGGRIFRAKITQGDYLAHDFVPCLDNNNRPCMYDLITQKPYYNQSGGIEFTYCLEHQLPSDFIKLDYIESTGTQIIKTGIVPTNSTGIYVDAYHTKHNGNTNWPVIGLRDTNGNTYFTVGRVQRDTNAAGFGWGTFTSPGGTGNVRYEATLNYLNDKKSIITAPSFAQRINALSTLSFTPTRDLYMFGMNNYNGAATVYSTYRIYRAKISEGSEIIRDYVPAYDTLKDKTCMYDLINNVAYYNDGTGEFVMPPKREGNYTGFVQLGGIGNRLGGGEIIFGIEPKMEYLYLAENEILNCNFTFVTVKKFSIKFEKDIYESNNIDSYNIIAGLSDGYYSEYPNEFGTGFGLAYHYQTYAVKSSELSWPIMLGGLFNFVGVTAPKEFEGVQEITYNMNEEALYYNNNKYEIDEFGNNELYSTGFASEEDIIRIFGNPNGIKVYEVKFWDADNNLISHMIPHEENSQKGLYCSIRNEFLPAQTLA